MPGQENSPAPKPAPKAPGKPAAAAFDAAGHGGAVVIGSPNVLIGGKPAARQGDPISCGLHGSGVVALGSRTVLINGKPAARMGDATGCLVPSLAAIPVPPTLGAKPIQGAVSLDPKKNGQFHEQNDAEKGGVSAMHAEGHITDANQDGSYDSIDGSAEVLRVRNKGVLGQAGPAELYGTHNLDIIYANGKYSAPTTDRGGSVSGSAEAGMVKWGGSVVAAPAGAEGRNGSGVAVEGNLFHAKAEGDILVGDDGNRYGLIAKGEAGAEVASYEVATTVTTPSVQGYNFQGTRKTGQSLLAAPGAGAGIWLYVDKKVNRIYAGLKGKIAILFGLESEYEISFGEEFKPDSPAVPALPVGGYVAAPGFGAGGVAGIILTGAPSVLIG